MDIDKSRTNRGLAQFPAHNLQHSDIGRIRLGFGIKVLGLQGKSR